MTGISLFNRKSGKILSLGTDDRREEPVLSRIIHLTDNLGVCIRFVTLCICALFFFTLTARADIIYSDSTELASVEDRAGLFSDSGIDSMLSYAEEIAETYGYAIRVLTIDDNEGKSTMKYAEDYFESFMEDDDDSGACYLIDMDAREFRVQTIGDSMLFIMTDDRVDTMLDAAYDYAADAEYDDAILVMLRYTLKYCREGVEEGTYIYDEDTGQSIYYGEQKRLSLVDFIVSIGTGIVGFFTMLLSVIHRYTRNANTANDYSAADNVHLNIKHRQDTFMTRHISRVRINDGGGVGGGHHGGGGGHVSTSHHTSGGHSSGGGGRKF